MYNFLRFLFVLILYCCVCGYFVGPYIFLSILLSNLRMASSFRTVIVQDSQPYMMTCLMTVLYILILDLLVTSLDPNMLSCIEAIVCCFYPVLYFLSDIIASCNDRLELRDIFKFVLIHCNIFPNPFPAVLEMSMYLILPSLIPRLILDASCSSLTNVFFTLVSTTSISSA